LASAALYTLGAGLFPLRICFVFIAAAFLLLAYLFFKTGLEALQEKFQHGRVREGAEGVLRDQARYEDANGGLRFRL
jgi:hypothetical protein